MEKDETPYDGGFFEDEASSSTRSAQAIVPVLNRILSPANVLDVGCGVGAFLEEFVREGVHDTVGLEGEWARGKQFGDPAITYRYTDLTHPVDLGRTFDVALCLEVGEHLDSAFADTLVETLTRHSRAICFSSAIPGQGGTHHVNEQWPEYWGRRFRSRGYACFDAVRPTIRRDPRVPTWYAQNILVYAHPGSPKFEALRKEFAPVRGRVPLLVRDTAHPIMARVLNALPPRPREVIYYRYRSRWKRYMPGNMARLG